MRFRVVWTKDATEDFLELWSATSERSALTRTGEAISELLSVDPLAHQYEVFGGRGTAIYGPLGVDFQVDSQKQVVVVIAAWPVT